MKMTVSCKECGKVFEIDIPDEMLPARKKRRNLSDEERARRAESMRAMRLSGVGGWSGKRKGDGEGGQEE